jgi:hypothetical protein
MSTKLLRQSQFFMETNNLPTAPGLPDGIVLNQKSQFGWILKGLAKEDVGTFYGHLVHFTSIWYILRRLGLFYGHLEYLPLFGMLYQEKSGNPTLLLSRYVTR